MAASLPDSGVDCHAGCRRRSRHATPDGKARSRIGTCGWRARPTRAGRPQRPGRLLRRGGAGRPRPANTSRRSSTRPCAPRRRIRTTSRSGLRRSHRGSLFSSRPSAGARQTPGATFLPSWWRAAKIAQRRPWPGQPVRLAFPRLRPASQLPVANPTAPDGAKPGGRVVKHLAGPTQLAGPKKDDFVGRHLIVDASLPRLPAEGRAAALADVLRHRDAQLRQRVSASALHTESVQLPGQRSVGGHRRREGRR